MEFRIRKTHTGRGVFAVGPILKGTRIATMTGKSMEWDAVAALIRAKKVRLDDPFQIGEDTFVLLDRIPRLFNHSCEPNAGIRTKDSLVALRDISPGEEITYDYSTVVCTHSTWNMRCKCGSPVCRKKIGNILSIPKKVLEGYIRARVIPPFFRKELLG